MDLLATTLNAPLADYMPGVRKAIIADLPRKRLSFRQHRALARRLRQDGYGRALIMPRTWKSALAPWLAGIPVRTGFVGEVRLGIVNDVRWGERKLQRMVDRCACLALPKDAALPAEWPQPVLSVPGGEVAAWRQKMGLLPTGRPVVALAPGAVGPAKRWHAYGELARRLSAAGTQVWVLGGPSEKELAAEIAGPDPANARDLTGHDLRNAILALAAADVAVSNDSGLLHVAAAIGTPSIGIFGPTSPWHWAPLNPLQATLEPPATPAMPAMPQADLPDEPPPLHADQSADSVLAATLKALTASQTPRPDTLVRPPQ